MLKAIEPIWKTKREIATRALQCTKKVLTWAARHRGPTPEGFWAYVQSKLAKIEVNEHHYQARPDTEAAIRTNQS